MKVDAKQAVNRNESASKLNFVHGCTHDLKQRATNKRMSRGIPHTQKHKRISKLGSRFYCGHVRLGDDLYLGYFTPLTVLYIWSKNVRISLELKTIF